MSSLFQQKIEKTFKVPRTLLSIVGCFPKLDGSYNMYCIYLVLFFLTYSTITTFSSMYLDWPDLKKVAMNASPFLASLASAIKFANYLVCIILTIIFTSFTIFVEIK